MDDKEMAKNIRDAAETLASAMEVAGRAGLRISIEMKPHNRDERGNEVKIYGFRPILSVTRSIVL